MVFTNIAILDNTRIIICASEFNVKGAKCWWK